MKSAKRAPGPEEVAVILFAEMGVMAVTLSRRDLAQFHDGYLSFKNVRSWQELANACAVDVLKGLENPNKAGPLPAAALATLIMSMDDACEAVMEHGASEIIACLNMDRKRASWALTPSWAHDAYGIGIKALIDHTFQVGREMKMVGAIH